MIFRYFLRIKETKSPNTCVIKFKIKTITIIAISSAIASEIIVLQNNYHDNKGIELNKLILSIESVENIEDFIGGPNEHGFY